MGDAAVTQELIANPTPGVILLSGVVGSVAFGLATEQSDIDRAGIWASRTRDLLGLDTLTESYHGKGVQGDYTYHEAGKYARLALGCNPSLLEEIWLPDYETLHPLGYDLLDIRQEFLSAKRVEDAYLGYAVQQLKKLKSRNDGTFGPDVRKRTAKHARHLYRLLQQGLQLYQFGFLTVRVSNPDDVHSFGSRVADGDIRAADLAVNSYRDFFAEADTVLPDEPNRAAVQSWLLKVRDHFYDRDV